MSEERPPIERHVATERFGKQALRTAHHLTGALGDGTGPDEPVLFRRGGPHRSLQGLESLLDAALREDESRASTPPTPGPPPPSPSPSPIDPLPPPAPAPFPQPTPTDPTAPPPAPSPGPLT